MTTEPCPACDDNAAAEAGHDPWAIVRSRTGYVRLNPVQYHRGATFFVASTCVSELHQLGSERAAHLEEMAQVAEAVFRCVSPRKLNYEALGNTVAHLHWWLTPRHHGDPNPRRPIWEDPDFVAAQLSEVVAPTDEDQALRLELRAALEASGLVIESSFV